MEIKYIDIKEFREKGYLQEVNRQFLHPLGLALEISINEDKSEYISGVWDDRDDPEGIIYDLANSSSDRIEKFKTKQLFIQSELDAKAKTRKDLLGYEVEPID